MNAGICVCVLLATLSSSCLGRPQATPTQGEAESFPPQPDASLSEHGRHARSVNPAGQMKPYPLPELAVEPGTSLSELLTRLISRKGTIRRNSVNSRAASMSGNHRIKDRDYVGWMDFGRRSAEEYEYEKQK